MTGNRIRLELVEYGLPVDLSETISTATGLSRARANELLIAAGERAAKTLGISTNPITIESKGVRAVDVAGLIRLGPSLELEIVPKFLGSNAAHAGWREDFFYLSVLSRHGRLLANEQLSSSGGAPRDLANLVARAFVDMYQARRGRPLRTYRRARETSFFIDGEPDPVDLLFPGPDGFEQELIRFDRRNAWNARISGAAKELLPEVSEASAAAKLTRVVEDLGPQSEPCLSQQNRVPNRHKSWQPIHDLSVDVLRGLGLTYKQGAAIAPGYVVATWRVWEDLLTIASRLGFGRSAVVSQRGHVLGSRIKPAFAKASALSVFPDCVIDGAADRPRFLLDAKYKGRMEKGTPRIAESDIYEAMAFSKATGCNRVVLCYPATPKASPGPVGQCSTFERVVVGPLSIAAIEVVVRGVSKSNGLKVFANNFQSGITAALLACEGASVGGKYGGN